MRNPSGSRLRISSTLIAMSSESSRRARLCCSAVRRPGAQYPMVDVLDVGCERARQAIGIEPSLQELCRGARRRRGAGAFGAVGEDLGVALIEPGDGVTQPIGGEDLAPPLPSLRVDLDRTDYFSLKGTDIELLVCYPSRRVPHAGQRE